MEFNEMQKDLFEINKSIKEFILKHDIKDFKTSFNNSILTSEINFTEKGRFKVDSLIEKAPTK